MTVKVPPDLTPPSEAERSLVIFCERFTFKLGDIHFFFI